MKKLLLFGLFFLSNILLFSQPGKVQEIFNRYAGKEGFTSVNLNDLASLTGNNFKEEMKKEIGDIYGIKILTYEAKKKANKKLGDAFAAELRNYTPDAGYKEFLSVNDGGNHVRMYTKKQGNKATEFLMIVIEKAEESVLIWINGSLNLNNVGKIGEIFQNLDQMNKGNKSYKKKGE